ncbi:hypothetical protein L7F22_039096 [Adiantum nelumboides]|nr:hypothetical protein [Adiantum nelumboides]
MLSSSRISLLAGRQTGKRAGECSKSINAVKRISASSNQASSLRSISTSIPTRHPVIRSFSRHRPTLQTSSLENGPSSSIGQERSQSSDAGLHPTRTLRAEVAGQSHSSISLDGGELNFRAFGLDRRRRTRLPTPLPPNLFDQHAVALRKRIGEASKKKPVSSEAKSSTADEGDHVTTDPTIQFGDFSTSTLQAMQANNEVFTPTQTTENTAILRACLSTGLVVRATKIFDDVRSKTQVDDDDLEQAGRTPSLIDGTDFGGRRRKAHNPLDISIYNAMLGAYLRKAFVETNSDNVQNWIRRAWDLLNDMQGGLTSRHGTLPTATIDPSPNATSFAVMAKGIVRLLQTRKYAGASPGLGELLKRLGSEGILVKDLILSPAFSEENAELQGITSKNFSREGEPTVRIVLEHLSSVAADLSNEAFIVETEEANAMLSALEKRAKRDVERDVALAQQEEEKTQTEEGSKDGRGKRTTTPAELLPVKTIPRDNKKADDQNVDERSKEEISFNLRVLKDNLTVVEQAKLKSADPYERQRWLEFSAMDAAEKRFDHANENLERLGLQAASSMQSKKLQRWMWEWYSKLSKALTADLERIRTNALNAEKFTTGSKGGMELEIYPFLALVPVKRLAIVTILELIRTQGMAVNGIKTAMALVSIGKQIEAESYASQLNKTSDFSKAKDIHALFKRNGITDKRTRNKLREMMEKEKQSSDSTALPDWTSPIRIRAAAYLVEKLMEVAKVKRAASDRDGVEWNEPQPAFHSTYQYIQGKRLGVIKLNDAVGEVLSKERISGDLLSPRHLPMLVPPKPWTDHETGGYYSVKSRALRYKEVAEQGSYLRHASANKELDSVLAGLDVLGSTAWTINRDVYDVVAEVWNSGKSIADIPPLNVDEEEPQRPANYDTDITARNVFVKRYKYYQLRKSNAHSERCDINYKLEIARAYLGESFYFPHNMDFRGRAYPIPPALNHIGNDLCRGLLLFADAKPLGAVGLKWLRIHLSNVFGYDKASFAERVQFAIDNMDNVLASVRDPLGPDGNWWLKADDPWQCLATCFELTKAMNYPDGPEKYPSRMPVHQDGTCNGLQHYAALGGDLDGAKQVNLSSGDRPADVYTGIADLVIKAIDKDIEKGEQTAMKLKDKVTRKVVKQTVMTTVYGVTFIGAKDQVMRQLSDRGDIAAEDLWSCASYLAKTILMCVGDLFSGAGAIQNWLTKSASLIAKSIPAERVQYTRLHDSTEGQENDVETPAAKKMTKSKMISNEQMTSVIWSSPLGLPIVQPYRKVIRKQVATAMQSVFLHDPQLSTQVSATKQASAFPPNFIHSLDATHMFLTALECQQNKLTFASVHDSYWTHACDIDTMSEIIRDTFIQLHSFDILPRLREEFIERYSGHYVPISSIKRILNADEEISELVEAAKKAKKDEDSKETNAPRSQNFVELAAILPRIPQKGNFDVEEIRGSQYFFS